MTSSGKTGILPSNWGWRAAAVYLIAGIIYLSLPACSGAQIGYITPPELRKKVAFSFAGVNNKGLIGSASGKVPLYYEFCIPNVDSCRAQVQQIDTTVQLQGRSPGRIGCKIGVQVLCIGNTHQAHYRRVVYELAALPYVERIERTYFE